ncbi:MAG: UPF0175 family protein [Xanthobacteraceae bacterium]
MDDNASTSGTFTEITVRIPDELARLVGASGKVERRVLEALALDEFRQGHLSRAELRRVLGLDHEAALDAFLQRHAVAHVKDATDDTLNLAEAIRRRFAPFGGVDLELPPRTPAPDPPRFE